MRFTMRRSWICIAGKRILALFAVQLTTTAGFSHEATIVTRYSIESEGTRYRVVWNRRGAAPDLHDGHSRLVDRTDLIFAADISLVATGGTVWLECRAARVCQLFAGKDCSRNALVVDSMRIAFTPPVFVDGLPASPGMLATWLAQSNQVYGVSVGQRGTTVYPSAGEPSSDRNNGPPQRHNIGAAIPMPSGRPAIER